MAKNMRKFIAILSIFVFVLILIPVLSVQAIAPNCTLTGKVITINVGQLSAMNQVTVTDAGGEILAATDLCIQIQGATNAIWDVTDTAPTFGGTQSGNVDPSVTYPDATTMKVDVTVNFAIGGTLTIEDLNYIGHTAVSGGAVSIWAVDNTDCTAATYRGGAATTTITVADGAQDTLTTLTTVPNSNNGGVIANYTVNFTVPAAGVIPANGKILVTFPAGFNVANATAGALTGIDGTVVLGVAGQVVTLTRQADGANSTAGAKTVVINTVTNPVAGGTSTLTVRTDTSGDELLATGTTASFLIHGSGSGGGGVSSKDMVPPFSDLVSPEEGEIIEEGTTYTIKGTAQDIPHRSEITKVEITLDDGANWLEATITDFLSNIFYYEYSWENPIVGEYMIASRATDKFENMQMGIVKRKVTVTSPEISSLSKEEVEIDEEVETAEKPISEMTANELISEIIEIQQKIINLLTQLIQLLSQ